MTQLPKLEPGTTVGQLGEFGLLPYVLERLSEPASGSLSGAAPGPVSGPVVGPGDDAAVLDIDGRVVVSTDLLVEGKHFRTDWSEAVDIGHKAAAQNLADICAMGACPTALTVGLGLPADTHVAWVLDLASGLAEECTPLGVTVVGGDLTASGQIVVAVTALGTLAGPPVTRTGAAPGDIVALAGRQGWAAAGLAVLGRGFRSPRAVVEAHRRPNPPYAAGTEAYALGATAMIDVSDGLVADVGHIARGSGVVIDLDSAVLEVPEPLKAVAAATGVDPLTFILGGGEDHCLVATFPADTALPDSWRRIGTVLVGAGVTVDGVAYDGPVGHQHF